MSQAHHTPLGTLWSHWSPAGLLRLTAEAGDANSHPEDVGSQARRLDRRLREFFETGVDRFLDIEIDRRGWTTFARRVYDVCRQIPAGQTCTYSELARRAGQPEGARAVGAAMARNRLLLVIPCHRVIAAGGSLCGFSAPGGLSTKRRLLELERSGQWPAEQPCLFE